MLYGTAFSQIKPIKPFGKVRALIVGISDYQNEKVPDLEYADRDAEAFARYLREETAWNAAPENVVLLTNETATYGKFLNELQALVDNTNEKDRLILYFAGHGDVERVEKDQMGYLLFYDVAPTTYASAGACMINTLNAYLEKLALDKGAEVILISDACRSGSLAGSSVGGPRATTAALSELFTHSTKIMSCEPDQISVEGAAWGGGRGLFSYHLVNGLKGLADQDEDRYVDLFELERYVQDSVRVASNRKQLPMIKGLSSTKLARVDQKVLEQIRSDLPPEPNDNWIRESPDTNFLPQLARFEAALRKKHLLFPEEGSANQIYQTIGDHPNARPVQNVMKISLASALQDEAQQALNEYIISPGKELARRWSDAGAYAYYPDYLARAAELLGPDNYFFNDVKSREHYFRGVNFRLQFDADDEDETMLQRALEEQQTALQLQSIAPHIHNELGLIFRRLEQYPQAVMEFQQALNLSPKWSLALTNLANVYKDLEQYALAEKMYRDAIQLDTSFALSYYNLSELYVDMGRTEAAVSQLEKVIRLDPEFADAYFNLSRLSLGSPQAESYILQYIQRQPDDPDGFSLLAYIYHSSDRLERAQQAYQSALQLDPDAFYSLQSLAYVYKRLEDFDAAQELWENYLERHPDDQPARIKLAGILAAQGKETSALALIREVLSDGFKDYDGLKKEPELNAMKDQTAYRALLKAFFPDRE